MSKFRFEDLEIWKFGMEISEELFILADLFEEKKKYRFAEQLNASTMSITNNIAEGSGSYSNADFVRFLNYSRRSVFECANIIAIMLLKKYILEEKKISLFDKLDHLSSMITNFQKKLLQ